MKGSKASALVIALSLMVLFTGLGLGVLNYSGMQGQNFVNQELKTQAFWLADAGLQAACSSGTASSSSFGTGSYTVTPNGQISAGGILLTSTGTQTTLSRILQATCTISPFNYGLYAPSLSGLPSPPPGPPGPTPTQLTIGAFNSSGATVTTGYNAIVTDASASSFSLSKSGVTITGGGSVVSSAGVALPSITVPSALSASTTPCSNITGYNTGTDLYTTGTNTTYSSTLGSNTLPWTVISSMTFPSSGNYQCASLAISSNTTLTIDTNVNLYLTGSNGFSGGGIIKIVYPGSLTIYANGQININDLSGGLVVNNSTSPAAGDSSVPSKFIIYSLDSSGTGTCSVNTQGFGNANCAVTISDVYPAPINVTGFYGLVYAPEGTIYLGTTQVVYGSLVGNNLAIEGNNSSLYYDEAINNTLGGLSNWTELS